MATIDVIQAAYEAVKDAKVSEFMLRNEPAPEDVLRELNGIHCIEDDIELGVGICRLLSGDVIVNEMGGMEFTGDIYEGLSRLLYGPPDTSFRVFKRNGTPFRLYTLELDHDYDIEGLIKWITG